MGPKDGKTDRGRAERTFEMGDIFVLGADTFVSFSQSVKYTVANFDLQKSHCSSRSIVVERWHCPCMVNFDSTHRVHSGRTYSLG